MDKLILIFYLPAQIINEKYIDKTLENLYNKEKIISIVLPSSSIKIECINPKLLKEDEYEKVKNIVNKLEIEFKRY